MPEVNLNDLLASIADDHADPRARLMSFSGLMVYLEKALKIQTGNTFSLSEETKDRLRRDPENGYSALESEFSLVANTPIHNLPDPELETTKFALHWKDAALPFMRLSLPSNMPMKFCAPLTSDPRTERVAHFATDQGYKNIANLLAQGCRRSFDRF